MAYKHSRWNNEKSNESVKINEEQTIEDSKEEESIFSKPPILVARVITAMDDYLKKVEDMKLSKRDLLRTVVDMCPHTWPNLHELSIYLDDQAEIWEVACEFLSTLMNRLKEYETQITDARLGLHNFQSRQTELMNMTAEYNKMQKTGKIPKAQCSQIKYMVAESERAMALIKADTEKKLLNFRRSQTEIGKEFLDKFEEALHMTYTESLQIVGMVIDMLGNIPEKKLNVFGQPRDDVEFVFKLIEKATANAKEAFLTNGMSTPSRRNQEKDARHDDKKQNRSSNSPNKDNDGRHYQEHNSTRERPHTPQSRRPSEHARPASSGGERRQREQNYSGSCNDGSRESPTHGHQREPNRHTSSDRSTPVQHIIHESYDDEKYPRVRRDSSDDRYQRTSRRDSQSDEDSHRRSPYRTRPLKAESRPQAPRDHSPYRYMYQDIDGTEDYECERSTQGTQRERCGGDRQMMHKTHSPTRRSSSDVRAGQGHCRRQ